MEVKELGIHQEGSMWLIWHLVPANIISQDRYCIPRSCPPTVPRLPKVSRLQSINWSLPYFSITMVPPNLRCVHYTHLLVIVGHWKCARHFEHHKVTPPCRVTLFDCHLDSQWRREKYLPVHGSVDSTRNLEVDKGRGCLDSA